MVLKINNLAATALFRPIAVPELLVLLHDCITLLHLLVLLNNRNKRPNIRHET
jgi:hypothetical protein